MTTVLDQDPPSGTVPYGAIEYYNDGSETIGTVTEIIGGSNSRGIPRQSFLVIDPRLTDNSVPTHGTFGKAAKSFTAGIAQSADPVSPIASTKSYIVDHLGQFRAAVSEIAQDSTIQAIAHHEAAFGLSPAQVLGQIIGSGVGAGVISDASKVAGAVGLSSGAGVVSVEAGALALTLGAISQDYASLTGGQFLVAPTERNIGSALTAFVNRSIHHNS